MYWLEELLTLFNVSPELRRRIPQVASLLAVLLPVPVIFAFIKWARPRQSVLPPYRERVLVLGASSGVGRELALAYARRGCRQLALVGRRDDKLEEVLAECEAAKKQGEEWEMSDEAPGHEQKHNQAIISIKADCSVPEDIVRVREECRNAFGGIDTVHVLFGVSALRPLLGVAGIDPIRKAKRAELLPDLPAASSSSIDADLAGLKVAQEATRRINNVNVVGTSIVLTALLPMLQTTSPSPSIHLLSSASAYLPAPTRPLYGSSKAAQLMLFQSVAIEAAAQANHTRTHAKPRRHVRFYASVPGTIKSDFRASAVDGPPDDAYDSSWDKAKGGGKSDVLLPADLAQHIILAIDQYKEGTEEMPAKYYYARRVLPFAPSLMAKMARNKYSYN